MIEDFEQEKRVVDILISGGPVMIPLGILSLVALAIILERLWVLRRRNFMQNATVETLSGLLASSKFRASVDYCRRHPGPFTDLVTALVENRNAPYEELKEILEDTGRLQLMGLQRGLAALATIVVLKFALAAPVVSLAPRDAGVPALPRAADDRRPDRRDHPVGRDLRLRVRPVAVPGNREDRRAAADRSPAEPAAGDD